MPDPQTPNKALFTPAHGADVNTWDVPMNANFTNADLAFGGATTLNANGISGTQALNVSQYTPLGFIVSGTPAGNVNYQVPSGVGGLWIVRNRTSGASITVGFSSAAGGSVVNIPQGTNVPITSDGSSLGMVAGLTATGAAAGSSQQVQFNTLGNLDASPNLTWDGLTFKATGLNINGNAVIGAGSGSTLTINGTAVSTPNGLNFNSGQIQFGSSGGVGIGIAPGASLLTVGGVVQSTTGGFTFPDASVQTTSATTYGRIRALANITAAGSVLNYGTNIASIVNNSAGNWTINFTSPIPANAIPHVQIFSNAGASGPAIVTALGTSSLSFTAYNAAGSPNEFTGYFVQVSA